MILVFLGYSYYFLGQYASKLYEHLILNIVNSIIRAHNFWDTLQNHVSSAKERLMRFLWDISNEIVLKIWYIRQYPCIF